MPFKGFVCPVPECSKTLDRQQALEHLPFAHGGVIPAAVVEAIWRSEEDPRRTRDHFSPSIATGCMREIMLLRTEDYFINPYRMWKMAEGTLWHKVMATHGAPGWVTEEGLPKGESLFTRKDHDVLEMKWEEMWLSGSLDARYADWSIIDDYKTQACPRTNYKMEYYPPKREAKDSEAVQLNLYGRMAMALHGLERMPKLRIWRYVLGIQEASYSWTAIPVDEIPVEKLIEIVRPNYGLLKGAWALWEQAVGKVDKDEVIARMPLQGRPMFNGKKCSQYCAMKGACDRLVGQVDDSMSGDV